MQVTSLRLTRSLPLSSHQFGDLAWLSPHLLCTDLVHKRIVAVNTWNGQIERIFPMYKRDVNAAAFSHGLIWQVSPGERTIFGIDPATHRAVHHVLFPTGMSASRGFDIDQQAQLWLSDPDNGLLVGLDMASGKVKNLCSLDRNVTGLTRGQELIYFSEATSGTIGSVKLHGGGVQRLFDVGGNPAGLTLVKGRLWCLDAAFDQFVELSL